MAKFNKTKVLAGFLALLMLVSMLPIGIFTTAFAAEIDSYVVHLTDGTDLLALDDVSITLTNKADETKTSTASTEGGAAEFRGFVEEEATYTLTIDSVVGYEDVLPFEFTVASGETSRDVTLTAIEKVKVSGTVKDETGAPYAGATIRVSGYAETETVTNDTGAYTFETYKGKEISVTVTASDEKYAAINSQATYNSDTANVNYQFEIKTFSILTNSEDVTNGTVTPTMEDISYGESREVEIQADEGYRIKEIVVNGTVYDEAKDLTQYVLSIEDITENYDVRVSFYQATYTVSFSVSSNGEVTYNTDQTAPGGKITEVAVAENDSVSFEAVANSTEGYHVEKVAIGDTVLLENGDNTTTTWTGTVTPGQINTTVLVTVVFAINEYQVNLNTVTNGTANLSSGDSVDGESVTVKHGDSVFVLVMPNDGYELSKIVVGNTAVEFAETENGYVATSAAITSDTTVDVVFAQKEALQEGSYEITLPEASKKVDGVTYVAEGSTLTFTPAAGYRVKINNDWGYCSADVGQPVSLTVGSEPGNDVEKITSIEVSRTSVGSWSLPETLNITIDNTKPTISAIENTDSWFDGETTYSFTVADSQSGVKEVKYSATGDKSTATVITPVDGKYSFNVADEFDGNYFIWVSDYCDNTLDATAKVQIDLKDPEITGYSFSTEENSVAQELIHFLSFGILCSQDIYVTITAEDEAVSSGLNTITLYGDGEELETKEVEENGSATFILTEKQFNGGKAIAAIVTDNSGRVSERTTPSNLGEVSDNIQITSAQPSATISVAEAAFTEKIDSDGDGEEDRECLWYNGEVAFTVTAYDNVSSEVIGIQSVTVSINGEPLTQDAQGENIEKDFSLGDAPVEKLEFQFNTAQIEATEGKNTIKVAVTNTAGVTAEYTQDVYIDRSAPSITNYRFEAHNDSALDRVLNFLTFGIFFNEQVEITVTAEDASPAAGVKSITLYLDDEKTGFDDGDAFRTAEVQVIDGKYQAVFTVPAEELEESDVFSANIGAKATDNVDNTTEDVVRPDTENSNVANSNLMLETGLPIITPDFADPVAVVDGKDWYADDVQFAIKVEDEHSGLWYTSISINGKLLVDDHYDDVDGTHTEKYVATYTVTTANAIRADDGSYTVNVSVTDNAGNVETYEKTIYKDIDQPRITKFDFAPVDYVEGDEENTNVEVTDYGFYFKEDTEVTISATDDEGASSGVQTITYYTVDYTENANGVISEEVEVPVDDNKITITIPANFKGQIYAKATDNVNNTTENFVTPDGAIVENANKHSEETHIAFEKAETTLSANDGTELYAEDVDVLLTVTDTYSGIREIEWSVDAPYDTSNNQSGKVTLNNDMTVSEGSETDWEITEKEANLATEMQKAITVHNNSNNIVVYVKMTDRAGNTSEDQIEFSIDKNAPVIQIAYDNNIPDAEYQNFFNANRTATVTITERNFNSEDVIYQITNTEGVIPELSTWEVHENKANPDETYYTATVTYTADGDYTFDIRYADLAQNAANIVPQHRFTIDKTLPRVSVAYDNNNALNGNYYNAARTATITITEHNFDAARVNVLGVATDNGAASVFPAISGWTSNGDTHVATIQYSADSRYTFDIEFLDKAGNSIADYAPEEFYVDMTAPNLTISGVADHSANNGDITPVITYSDTNFNRDAVTISLSGIHNGPVQYAGSYADIANGQTFTYENFEKVQNVDDIYTLTARVTDLAGNATEMTISFSANRFGSVYDLSSLENILNQYLQTEQDIVFTETNVDSLDRDGILIKLTKNGTPIDLVEGTDYAVEVTGGDGQWSVYRYTIFKSLFADDGRYSISVYSVDAAGNINENIDEIKNAEISFGIDKTAPVIVPVDLESGKQYPVEEKTVSIEIKDNLVLANVKIYLNGEEIDYTVEGEVYTFNIPASNSVQDVRIVATDAAGNEYELLVEDFLVSTNIFARWYNNTPLFIGSIAGVIALVLALIAFLLFRKKKKDEGNS